ncbi:hypothetical protein OAL09_09705 [Verrucomicrobia bacterium]|jgi:hypothetical protein|nr:hypothetical protein [Verrucomicrobiales bacterium]MDC0049602.1 hypothetical protein [Verrucomicrobiota bacterium]NCG26710.1 hypothetical protein [Verrucomicrobiales bacterium]|tara:strand:+ start:213 stop:647 length:435 start_codon:yes stop_codon:yes gene_type:complete
MKNLSVLLSLLWIFAGCKKENTTTENTRPTQEEGITDIVDTEQVDPNRPRPLPPKGAVNIKILITDPEGLFCSKDSEIPFSGKVYAEYPNGYLSAEGTLKDGQYDGLWFIWHENGQKQSEENFKEGKSITVKNWNERGELIEKL